MISGRMLLCSGFMCRNTTNAIPGFGGTDAKNSFRALIPPADAPLPTTGNLSWSLNETTSLCLIDYFEIRFRFQQRSENLPQGPMIVYNHYFRHELTLCAPSELWGGVRRFEAYC